MDNQLLFKLSPAIFVALGTLFLMVLVGWIIGKKFKYQPEIEIIRVGVLAGLALTGSILLVLVLPVAPETQDNILKIGGLLLSALVIFSSTTVIRDLAAGIAMRFFSPYRPGDYLSTDNYFGRVTEFGLIHTELQTIDRSLVTFSNAKLLSDTFKTIPASGTLVSVEVSLGYDIPHQEVEKHLLTAAEEMDLEEPFVHLLELGNFWVRYRVSGLLEEVEDLLTIRSNFRRAVLDKLHAAGVEIVSPDYLNRRDLASDQPVIPEATTAEPATSTRNDQAEEIAFQKALEVEKVEKVRQVLEELENHKQELQEKLNAADNKDNTELKNQVSRIDERIAELEKHLENLETETNSD